LLDGDSHRLSEDLLRIDERRLAPFLGFFMQKFEVEMKQ